MASVSPNPTSFETETESQHAGPSNYQQPRARRPAQYETRSYDKPERVGSNHYEALVSLVNVNRDLDEEQLGYRHWDRTWEELKSLNKKQRDDLTPALLKRVLRHVVPPGHVARAQMIFNRNAADLSEADISTVTQYTWEPRLQLVASLMKSLEPHNGDGVVRPQDRVLEIDDYLFVLRQFAVTGHLAGSERVVKEMIASGIPLDIKVYDLRLAVLTKWLTIRKDIYRRFVAHKARTEDTHTYGVERDAIRDSTPFFPPDIAELFQDMLKSMKGKKEIVYRQFTYDMILRVAKETGNKTAMEKMLKTVYQVDLEFPETEMSALRSRLDGLIHDDDLNGTSEVLDRARGLTPQALADEPQLNTHAFNTLIFHLAERGDLKAMLQAFEVFGQPVHEMELASEAETLYSAVVEAEVEEDVDVDAEFEFEGVVAGKGEGETTTTESREHEVNDVDDEPLTLSEALAREEASGQRLGFFGQTTTPDPSIIAGGESRVEEPGFPIRPAHVFLPRIAFPKELEASLVNTLRSSSSTPSTPSNPLQSLRELEHTDQPFLTNSSTYRTLIKACAVHSSLSTSSTDRRQAFNLGLHFLLCASRDMMWRHNRFLATWIKIRETTSDLRLPRDWINLKWPDGTGDINPIRRALRSRLIHPALTVDSHMVSPLFKMLRQARSLRGDPENRRWVRRNVRVLEKWVERVRRYQEEEWRVMTGREWKGEGQGEGEAKMTGLDKVKARWAEREREAVEVVEAETKKQSGNKMEDAGSEASAATTRTIKRSTRPAGPVSLPPGFFTSSLVDRLGILPSLLEIVDSLKITQSTTSSSSSSSSSPTTTLNDLHRNSLTRSIWSRLRSPSDPVFTTKNHLKRLDQAGRSLEGLREVELSSWGLMRRREWFLKRVGRRGRVGEAEVGVVGQGQGQGQGSKVDMPEEKSKTG